MHQAEAGGAPPPTPMPMPIAAIAPENWKAAGGEALARASAQVGVSGFKPTGKPWYQTSVNMVDILWAYLNTTVTTRAQAHQFMASACGPPHNFGYIRFAATPFWPKQFALYRNNSAAHWAVFDAVVADAKAAGCRLVPSIFWNTFAVPDVVGEPLSRLWATGSKTRAFAEAYTAQLVSRYAQDDTILMYELGNEMNLLADLDLSVQQPLIAPAMGTPARRTRADNFSTAMLMQWQGDLAGWIRKADTVDAGLARRLGLGPRPRPVSSGNSCPRANAEHLRASYHAPHRDWTPDTREQFAANLLDVNAAADVVNVHYYNESSARWGNTDPDSTVVLQAITAAAASAGKAVYIGEFGQSVAPGDPHPKRPFNRAVLQFVQDNCVAASTVWIWQFYQQAGVPTPKTLVPSRPADAAYIADTVAANKAMANTCAHGANQHKGSRHTKQPM